MTEKRIAELLKEIGIPKHLVGFRYMESCVKLLYENSGQFNQMTNWLYPEVARKYKGNWKQIENGIRYAIQKAWESGTLQEYYMWKPRCSELLIWVSMRLRKEQL